MKRILSFSLALTLFLLTLSNTLPTFAATSIELDGKPINLKYAVQPERAGNILLLPIRDTAEALGAAVTYEPATRTARCEKGGIVLRVALGDSKITINGKTLVTDAPASLRNGRMMAAAHVFEQAFGLSATVGQNQLKLAAREKTAFKVATLNGPTGVAMAQLIRNDYLGENADMSYEVLSNPQLLPAKLIKGEVDMAFLPTNMASIIYNQSKGQVVMVSANIWGLLSVLTTDPALTDWSDLKGKQIDIFGQGATPEVAFKALAEANGLNPKADMTYKFSYDAASTLATAMIAGQAKDGLAVLPEPATSMVLQKNKNARILFSFGTEWSRSFGGAGMPMSVMVVRKAFLEQHQDLVRSFLREFRNDIAQMNASPKSMGTLVDQLPELGFSSSVVETAIPRSGYRFETASSAKAAIRKYLETLMAYDAKTVGGVLPGDDFYADVFTDY